MRPSPFLIYPFTFSTSSIINQLNYPILIEQNVDYRKYYGMSTKKAQKEMGKKDLHTSEGIEIIIKVEYNLIGWIENFTDY